MATVVRLARGGEEATSIFSLMGHYLIGYVAGWVGLLIGLVEVGTLGYLLGVVTAWLHNSFLNLYIILVRRRVEALQYRDIL